MANISGFSSYTHQYDYLSTESIFNWNTDINILTLKIYVFIGVDVLGDQKKRRDSWDMGFKGDYMDFPNNPSLQNVIGMLYLTLNDWSRGEQSLSDLLYSKAKQKQILKNALRFQRQHQATPDHLQQRSTLRG